MDIISNLSDLLPILPPFEIETIHKDDSKLQVLIQLKVMVSNIPLNHSIHSYYERQWEHLKLFQYRTFIKCKIPIYKDKSTGVLTKPSISFSRDYSRFTLLFEAEVMRLMNIHYCFRTVAKSLHIHTQRVESIYHYYTQHLENDFIKQTPVNIAYDETAAAAASTKKGHDYITTLFDLDHWEIIGIYDGKSSECVHEFMQSHPYPEAIQNISIDMYPAFISGANQYFPKADVTFDKWHVIKLIYRHLDKLESQVGDFKDYIYLLMNQITDFYHRKQYEQLAAQLMFIADFAQEQLKTNAITKTIKSHFKGITNYSKSKVSNGILEGINSKIQAIKRIARGFRYKSTFKKMIRFAFQKNNFQVIS